MAMTPQRKTTSDGKACCSTFEKPNGRNDLQHTHSKNAITAPASLYRYTVDQGFGAIDAARIMTCVWGGFHCFDAILQRLVVEALQRRLALCCEKWSNTSEELYNRKSNKTYCKFSFLKDLDKDCVKLAPILSKEEAQNKADDKHANEHYTNNNQ
eukprot:6475903-Amphidinium_carterae.1